jgi:hypothetical protein
MTDNNPTMTDSKSLRFESLHIESLHIESLPNKSLQIESVPKTDEHQLKPPENLKNTTSIFPQVTCVRTKSGENVVENRLYVVVGWFLSNACNPTEDIIWIPERENLLAHLQVGIRHLEGWSRFYSLKSLSGFGLYMVCRA